MPGRWTLLRSSRFPLSLRNQSNDREIPLNTSRVTPTLYEFVYGRLTFSSGFDSEIVPKLAGTVAKLISHVGSVAKLQPGLPWAMLSLFLSVHGAAVKMTSALAGS